MHLVNARETTVVTVLLEFSELSVVRDLLRMALDFPGREPSERARRLVKEIEEIYDTVKSVGGE